MIHLKSLTLVVMTGLPGCGKTTVIAELRRLVDLTYVETDACWLAAFPEPKYTPEESRAVFGSLVALVTQSLSEGRCTIAEGVFASPDRIARLREIAGVHTARFLIVGVQCDSETAFARMNARHAAGGHSPVTVKLWADLLAKQGAWRDREGVSWIDSGTSTPEHSARLILPLLLAD